MRKNLELTEDKNKDIINDGSVTSTGKYSLSPKSCFLFPISHSSFLISHSSFLL